MEEGEKREERDEEEKGKISGGEGEKGANTRKDRRVETKKLKDKVTIVTRGGKNKKREKKKEIDGPGIRDLRKDGSQPN